MPARPGAPKRPAADPGAVPPPGEQIPPPASSIPQDIPAPGEQSVPIDIPAPGQVLQPEPPAQARRGFEAADGAAPFAAGGSFDPSAGIIADTGGEIPQKGNKGLMIVAAGAALAFGVALGYVFNSISSKGALVKQGQAKGEMMFTEVQKVSEMRKGISLKMEDLGKAINTNPDAAAKDLVDLLTNNFEKSPKVDDLFGWQLASIGTDGIKKTFDLYEEANGLRVDLGYLAGFVNNNIKPLSAGGPRVLGILFKGGNAILVERVEAMCGEANAPTACPEGKEKDAIGFSVRADRSRGRQRLAAVPGGQRVRLHRRAQPREQRQDRRQLAAWADQRTPRSDEQS